MPYQMRDEIDRLLLGSSLDEETREYVAQLVLDGEEEDLAEALGGFLCDGDEGIIEHLLLLQASPPEKQPELRRLTEHQLSIATKAAAEEVVKPTVSAEEVQATQTTQPAMGLPAAPMGAPLEARFGTDDYGSAQHSALDELDDLDDHATKWAELKASDGKGIWSGTQKRYVTSWGGRGMGGRGVSKVYSTSNPNVHLDNVTLHYKGKELLGTYSGAGTGNLGLVGSLLQLQQGHCYGLIGRNGVGKSTLLKRIARGSLPGFPPHIRCFYLQQEGLVQEGAVLEALLKSDDRLANLQREVQLWESLDAEQLLELGDESGPEEQAAYLALLYERLEYLEGNAASHYERAKQMLKELGFTRNMCIYVGFEPMSRKPYRSFPPAQA